MASYLVRRFSLMLLTLFGISVIIFALLRLVPGNISDILFDKRGVLWFSTLNDGLYCFSEGRLFRFDESEGMPDIFVYNITEDREGNIWAGTDGGVVICTIKEKKPAVKVRKAAKPVSAPPTANAASLTAAVSMLERRAASAFDPVANTARPAATCRNTSATRTTSAPTIAPATTGNADCGTPNH